MLAPPIQTLLSYLRAEQQPVESDQSEPPVNVNALTSKAGRFYERIRYLFDYKEEHTIRRSAVERQLRRRLTVSKPEAIGQGLGCVAQQGSNKDPKRGQDEELLGLDGGSKKSQGRCN